MSANTGEVLAEVQKNLREGMSYNDLNAQLLITLITAVTDVAGEIKDLRTCLRNDKTGDFKPTNTPPSFRDLCLHGRDGRACLDCKREGAMSA